MHRSTPGILGRGTLEEVVGDEGIWLVRSEAPVQPGDRLVLDGQAQVIERVVVARSPVDPPPPRPSR